MAGRTIEYRLEDEASRKAFLENPIPWLESFIDKGPFVVIEPNRKERKTIKSMEKNPKGYIHGKTIIDGSLRSRNKAILVLGVGILKEQEEIPMIYRLGVYVQKDKRYEELNEMLEGKE